MAAMTAAQRSAAAYKAAATKRARAQQQRQAGYAPPPYTPPPYTPPPPPPPASAPMRCPACGVVFPANTVHRCVSTRPPVPPPSAQAAPPPGRAFAPKPTVDNARATVLVALEDLYALQCKETGITDERRECFRKYRKALAYALGPISNQAMKNEADTALRVAAIQLVKVTF